VIKQFLEELQVKPIVICLQETWLKPVCRDRVAGKGGGCATFIMPGIPYMCVRDGVEQEYVVVKVWLGRGI
jgi:hypothetical protein